MFALISFLLVLSVLVLIHELGHYVAARLFKVKAEEFGYGFPPRLIGFVREDGKWKRVGRQQKKEYKNTIWSLNWLPLGGFVRIKGETPEEDGRSKDQDSFQSKPIWQRIIILAAGVGMNWFLAFILFSFIFMLGAPAILEGLPESAQISDRRVSVTNILPGSPAEQAGLEAGDRILSIAGTESETQAEAIEKIKNQGFAPFEMRIQRGESEELVQLSPTYVSEIDRPGIGIALADVGVVRFAWHSAIREGASATVKYTGLILQAFGGMLRDLLFLKGVQEDFGGPVAIAVLTGRMAKQGLVPLLQFSAILSINLAVLNFLPIPALDGGRVVLLVIEKVRRRALAQKLEAAMHQIAFLALIILLLLITMRDIGRYHGLIWVGLKGLIGL